MIALEEAAAEVVKEHAHSGSVSYADRMHKAVTALQAALKEEQALRDAMAQRRQMILHELIRYTVNGCHCGFAMLEEPKEDEPAEEHESYARWNRARLRVVRELEVLKAER